MKKSKKPKEKLKEPKGVLSIEHFSHFQCHACKGWWGIGDAPPRRSWICPWCGVNQSFVDKTPRIISKTPRTLKK